ncbi:MAG: bifunctional DNA-formamidopyrimidine glycosylase/DNA-(apurinic or apyrimidinic site) lyase [Pelagibacteraceae bacterium]
MPELPEVEVVRKSLNRKIKNKEIKKVLVKNKNLRFKVPSDFKNFLKNKKVINVNRFSKYLILCLNNKSYCLIHLGMSGTIHLLNLKEKNIITNTSFYNSPLLPNKHNHIEIFFKDLKLIYNDPRRFGFFQILNNDDQLKKRFKHLGPEPFQSTFNLKYLRNFFKGKEKNIKSFLIDQNFVSGIGNIYASEILFLSKINPFKKAKLLSENDCKKIIFNSRKILLQAIKRGGSSIKNFKNSNGNSGSFQKEFNAYQREGEKCKNSRCKGMIKKVFISNRSTFFCDICQI